MSKAMQLVGIILLGVITLVIINLMNDVRSTNELDYYLLQEVTEASMYDAVDYSYYRESGLLKVDRDMFLESFTRRFAESVKNDRDYDIKIIDFNETPPKVSIEVKAPTVASVKGEVAIVTNRVSGIIETIYDDYVYSRGLYGTENMDSSPPTITFEDKGNNKYVVLLADEYVLYGYKVIKLNDSNKHSANSICSSIKDWDEPKQAWASSQALELSLTNEPGYWIAAMDGSGNCSVRQLSDIAPWIKALTYNSVPSNTSLVATMADDHGLIRYYIAPSSWSNSDVLNKCSSNPTLCKATNIKGKESTDALGNIYYESNIDIKLNSLGLKFNENYRLFVLDNNNHMTKSTKDLLLRQSHKPTLVYEYNLNSSTDGTLKLTISDTGNDLKGYKYSTSNNTPVNDSDYIKLSANGQTISLKNIKEGNHYIWVKDKQDDLTKLTLNIDLDKITAVKYCESGGKLNEEKTLCYYSSNKGQCGTNDSWNDCVSGSPNECVGGEEKYTYDGLCNDSRDYSGSTAGNGCNDSLECFGKKNCSVTSTQGKCNAYGCELSCHSSWQYSCKKTGTRWNDCLTTKNTCQGGWVEGPAKSCNRDSLTKYSCKDGYTKSDTYGCFKISAS